MIAKTGRASHHVCRTRLRPIWLGILGLGLCCGTPHARAADPPTEKAPPPWTKIAEGAYQSAGFPHGYALVADQQALCFGACSGMSLESLPGDAESIELVLLTHHHRDSVAQAGALVKQRVPVRATKASQPWLSVAGVDDYWRVSIPVVEPGVFPPLHSRFWGNWSYLVVPRGLDEIDFSLDDGQTLDWRGWQIKVVATPGHSRDHTSYVVRRIDEAEREAGAETIAFCGDALASPGKLWSPYTTDWHHQNDEGLTAAAESLRKLAAEKPAVLCPEHGEPIYAGVDGALASTALTLKRLAILKSYERYTKEIVGDPPEVKFLAPEQVGTANAQGNAPKWTRLSEHLFLCGNMYAVIGDDKSVLIVDPYSQDVLPKLRQLQTDEGVGPLTRVIITHAHNDHYTGVFALPDRDSFKVMTLENIAYVISDPWRLRAPYVDVRPLTVDVRVKDGEIIDWSGLKLKFHHFPGQTTYHLAVETTIDGRKCLFTGDNFYHAEQYSGSGGWSGRNRGLPNGYARSAKLVRKIKPDWILAEHGGAFEFHDEDFRRREEWAEAAYQAAGLICPSLSMERDWDPDPFQIQPAIQRVRPRQEVSFSFVNPQHPNGSRSFDLTLEEPPVAVAKTRFIESPGEANMEFHIRADTSAGRHVIPMRFTRGDGLEVDSDNFIVLMVE